MKWDCGLRVQRGILKNAAPVPGPYKVGDIISYCRRARLHESGIQWSVGSRIVGFETDPNYPNRPPASCWVICDGLSVLVALDKIRPCTAAELLAYQFMHGKDIPDNVVAESPEQQAFIDERATAPKRQKSGAVNSAIPENVPVPEEMEVEPPPLENADIMDEDTLDDLLQEDPNQRPNQSLSSTATAIYLRMIKRVTPGIHPPVL